MTQVLAGIFNIICAILCPASIFWEAYLTFSPASLWWWCKVSFGLLLSVMYGVALQNACDKDTDIGSRFI